MSFRSDWNTWAGNGTDFEPGLPSNNPSDGESPRRYSETGSVAATKSRSSPAASFTSAAVIGPAPPVGIAWMMLLVIVSVSTWPLPRVRIGPVMLRSMVSEVTVPSIQRRQGTSSRPSRATANGEAVGVAPGPATTSGAIGARR